MSAGSARLLYALKILREKWEITREQWTDKNALDFEKNHITPLEHQVGHALKGMDKISEVISKVKQDCASPE